ncbi:MAG TPA: regulatory iron-sulfur-containing complex subunit RicT, partial [Tepidisphaeraceae bacterium]|nr:regulatory iron-sulfur-containing complex subunit RicT [Tepidisphaeraceae bacterium]
CGQHCCCRQFLKVLRPVNMGAAKMQKATLDPSKISGRCGRLKCCLRYEEATYEELRKRLPKLGTRVFVQDGEGVVEETMILTQLVKVRLENDRTVAVSVEELLDHAPAEGSGPRPPRRTNGPERPARPEAAPYDKPLAAGPTPESASARQPEKKAKPESRPERSRRERPRRDGRPGRSPAPQAAPAQPARVSQPAPLASKPAEPKESAASVPKVAAQTAPATPSAAPAAAEPVNQPGIGMLGRRRRRGRGRGRDGREGAPTAPVTPPNSGQ